MTEAEDLLKRVHLDRAPRGLRQRCDTVREIADQTQSPASQCWRLGDKSEVWIKCEPGGEPRVELGGTTRHDPPYHIKKSAAKPERKGLFRRR